ncbi:uncharacterized protein FFE2_08689 [Fusarium fujikuroi]|nr:uncharacterized protein FFE2_08689 [Fusarium fujikuroi]SCV48565.1 uncharacterized protein FFFS_08634 [Fusarium fujikuroi]
MLLLLKVKKTAARRDTRPNLTITASDIHYTVDFNEEDASKGIFSSVNIRKETHMTSRYPTTKLLEVAIVRKVAARRLEDLNPVTINTMNPALCNSELKNGEERQIFKVNVSAGAEARG